MENSVDDHNLSQLKNSKDNSSVKSIEKLSKSDQTLNLTNDFNSRSNLLKNNYSVHSDDFSMEDLFFNFYSLYFTHRNIFTKKKYIDETIKAQQSESPKPVQDIKENKKSFLNIFTKIKQFFKKSKKQKNSFNEKIFIDLLAKSKINKLHDEPKGIKFEFPGYSEIEIQRFLFIYEMQFEHVCEFCSEQTQLSKILLMKDISMKIFETLKLFKNSVFIIAEMKLGSNWEDIIYTKSKT